MQTITRDIPYTPHCEEERALFPEDALFFDIETTGFSSAGCMIYLIGAACRIRDTLKITQFFADGPAEEADLLSAFSRLLSGFRILYTYNGTGFDLPFLNARCRHFSLPDPAQGMEVRDLFKTAGSLRRILGLENYRQKTVEAFLGASREDRMNGGELIGVYREFTRHPDPEELNLLLLHNFEDVVGMTAILSLYLYRMALESPCTIRQAQIHTYETNDGEEACELLMTLLFRCPVPVPLTLTCGRTYLFLSNDHGQMRVPIFRGELHYFYSNYHDYYYLPLEDRAIHKDVASFVDKGHREKCHAYNCYTRKSGLFLPQQEEFVTPAFRHGFRDTESYFEIRREMFERSPDGRYLFLESYAAEQIRRILQDTQRPLSLPEETASEK